LTLIAAPRATGHPATDDAHRVLVAAHSTCEALYRAFHGSTTHNEPTDHDQDLLRAMLVFASAGLDSMVKQLVKDALPVLIVSDREARERLAMWVERQLKTADSPQWLASALVADSSREQIIGGLIAALRSGSLQSVDELARAASFFAVGASDVISDIDALQAAFRTRNQITHEMDVDFSTEDSIRRQRTIDELEHHANAILGAASNMLVCVGERLERAQAPVGT
jgi:hypothetical protein